jgi:hypothetical protein
MTQSGHERRPQRAHRQLMDEPDSKGVNLKVPERACLDLVGTGRFPGLVAGFEKRSGRH